MIKKIIFFSLVSLSFLQLAFSDFVKEIRVVDINNKIINNGQILQMQSYLKNKDFQCFKGKKAFFAMTAHILYSNIDDTNPASQSKIIIQDIIRRKIRFKGLIISDDISMNALKYDLVENAKKCIAAGCNLVLYCSGKYNESKKLLQNLEFCDAFTRKKTSEFYKFLR